MNKKVQTGAVAVIDIGSDAIRLKIAEGNKKCLKYIESLSFPLSLGKDTFESGKISYEKVDKACDIIKNYLIVANGYGVSKTVAVATSAVREATNRDYILDQIKISTGLKVSVVDDNEEKLYIYKLMSHLIEPAAKNSSMLVYIGSGNVGVSIYDDGKIPFSQNIKIGSLRISEIFLELQNKSSEYFRVVEEYLNNFTSLLIGKVPKGLSHFIASGHEVSIIAGLCGVESDNVFRSIPRERFISLYNELKLKTVDMLTLEYNVPVAKAHVLLPAMSIFYSLLSLTDAKEIIAPEIAYMDSVIFEILYPDVFSSINKEFNKYSLISAEYIAKRYNQSDSHYLNVEKYSVKIFDKMKKIHGMGSREKLYLQVAAILHDIGSFISQNKHYAHSHYLVMASDIVGLSLIEKEIIACICLYHSSKTPKMSDKDYKSLSSENRVLVSKLVSILRLADAIDFGDEAKFTEIDAKLTEDELIITISTDENTDLIEWTFQNKSRFFKEVFGIKAILKKRRTV